MGQRHAPNVSCEGKDREERQRRPTLWLLRGAPAREITVQYCPFDKSRDRGCRMGPFRWLGGEPRCVGAERSRQGRVESGKCGQGDLMYHLGVKRHR